MLRDNTAFKQRFQRWKNGELVYENGRVLQYKEGKDAAVDNIIRNEGVSYRVTRDPGNGVLSIGSGLNRKKWIDKFNKQGVWTDDDNYEAVSEEVNNIRSWLPNVIPGYSSMPKEAQDVLVDIGYNIGQGGLSKAKSPKFIAAIERGDWNEAARLMDWGNNLTGIDGKPLTGLIKRNAWRLKTFLDAMNNTQPPLKVIDSDSGRKMIFSPSFWNTSTIEPLLKSVIKPVTVPTIKQLIVEQLPLEIQKSVLLPETYVYGNKRDSFLPEISELFSPRPLSDYIKEYMRKLLNIPRIPSVHLYAY